ncbi:hypothetical protein GCM10025787_13910 [Saccharopolyspora rosea]
MVQGETTVHCVSGGGGVVGRANAAAHHAVVMPCSPGAPLGGDDAASVCSRSGSGQGVVSAPVPVPAGYTAMRVFRARGGCFQRGATVQNREIKNSESRGRDK